MRTAALVAVRSGLGQRGQNQRSSVWNSTKTMLPPWFAPVCEGI
jgi:hypothetical protein